MKLKEAYKALIAAAQDVVDNSPCSDPDCCNTAIRNAEATDTLEKLLKELPHVGD